jgi:hypothetical protein
MQRHEFLIELVPSFFATLKREITSVVRGSCGSAVLIEEVPTRLLLRGDQCSLDVTLLSIEHEAIRVRYGQKRQAKNVDLKLDMLEDALVLRDLNDHVIENPADYVVRPFVVGLKNPPPLAASGFSHAMAAALARLKIE